MLLAPGHKQAVQDGCSCAGLADTLARLCRDPPAMLQLVSEAVVRQVLQAEKDAEKLKRTMMSRMDFLDEF